MKILTVISLIFAFSNADELNFISDRYNANNNSETELKREIDSRGFRDKIGINESDQVTFKLIGDQVLFKEGMKQNVLVAVESSVEDAEKLELFVCYLKMRLAGVSVALAYQVLDEGGFSAENLIKKSSIVDRESNLNWFIEKEFPNVREKYKIRLVDDVDLFRLIFIGREGDIFSESFDSMLSVRSFYENFYENAKIMVYKRLDEAEKTSPNFIKVLIADEVSEHWGVEIHNSIYIPKIIKAEMTQPKRQSR